MSRSLTTGNGFSAVIRFSFPLIVGAFIQQIYNITDSMIVGNMTGAQALAAIGSTGSSLYFLFALNSGLANGCSVVIAQSLGAGDAQKIRSSLASTVYYTLLCGAIISLLGYHYAQPLLRLLGTPDDILPLSSLYLRICTGAAMGQILYNNVAAVLHAFGDSKTPLCFLLFCTVVNVLLDILMVGLLSWGVAGAAVATVMSQLLSGILCLCYALRKYPQMRLKRKEMKPSYSSIGEIAGIGLPVAFQSTVLSVGDMIVMSTINGFGTAMVAAYAAASRIHQMCIIPFLQFAIAFCTFSAQNIGAGQGRRVRRTMAQCSVFVTCASVLLGLIIWFARLRLLGMFVPGDDPLFCEVMEIGGSFLSIVPPMYPFVALIWLTNYMLRGAGENRIPLLSCMIELVAKIYLPMWLGQRLGFAGVWYGFPLCWILGWIPSFLYYLFGDWAGHYTKRHPLQK